MPVLIILLSLLALALVLFIAANSFVNDHGVPGRAEGFDPDKPHSVLAVFAHPDDEVMAAGTLARLKRHGEVYSLYLTHGEDGPTGGLVEKAQLGALREQELGAVKAVLGLDGMEILSYPDRYLNTVPPETLKGELRARIDSLRPDTVICFDRTIGLYGHTDHAFAGVCTQELLESEDLGVRWLLEMTLCRPMLALAQRVSKTFRERYDPSRGLPEANLGVNISRFSAVKMAVVKAHKSQWQVMGDVQPLYDALPAWLYYRIFSREYFHIFTAHRASNALNL